MRPVAGQGREHHHRGAGVRLHRSAAAAAGGVRDLLAASFTGTGMDGAQVQGSSPLLQLPALDAATERALAALEERFGQHPWLRAKIELLRELADQDAEIMAKEVYYSMSRMSHRLVSSAEDMQFSQDETESLTVPAFLRKKVSEGGGKKHGR